MKLQRRRIFVGHKGTLLVAIRGNVALRGSSRVFAVSSGRETLRLQPSRALAGSVRFERCSQFPAKDRGSAGKV